MRPILGAVFLLVALIAIVLSVIAYSNMSTLLDPANANFLKFDDYPVFKLYSGDLLAAAKGGEIDVAKLAGQLQRRIATIGLASILMIAIAMLLILPGSGKPHRDEHDLDPR